ncbi:MAG TPA: ATP-binding protein [Casimicrobiaceae bacterium]|nr:ATP-binding protein [Casimicrobiaceae bacterium]
MPSDTSLIDDARAARRASRTFAARLARIPEISRFVEAFCATHDAGRDDTLRMTLVVEELFANTIAHGHRGECDAPIVVSLHATAEGVELCYEDTAPRFDLSEALDHARRPLEDEKLAVRPIGGLGLRLIAQYVECARYVYEQGRNRVSLRMRHAV